MNTRGKKIYIVDDNATILESLSWVISSIGYQVETFNHAQDFLSTYTYHFQPGCLLLDARMPDISGPELQQILKKSEYHPPIIFISGISDVSLAVRVIKEGAIDFIVKPVNEQLLFEAINKALTIDQENRNNQKKSSDLATKFDTLSNREKEILQAIYEGKSNKIIASERQISLKTVESHRSSMMKKMGFKSVSELVQIYTKISAREK